MFTLLAVFGMPGPVELLIVAGIVLLLFGKRLPGVMRNMGRSIVEFKKGVQGIEDKANDDAATSDPVANKTAENKEQEVAH